jgi:hypothetical protein
MAGSPLEEFTTLMQSTGPAWMRGPENLINEAVRKTYTGNRICAAGSMMEMCQGGDQIEDIIFLGETSDYARYNPNEAFTYDMPQTGTKWTAPWAFAKASVSWTKQDIGLNVESMGAKYRASVYKRVMHQKHQNLWTGVCNGIEDEFWAQPDSGEMESSTPTGPRKPYSIPVFINEFTLGKVPARADAGGVAWSTIQGIDPAGTGNSKWAPYSVGGGSGAAAASDGYDFDASTSSALDTAGLFPAFTKAFWNLRFDRLPKKPEYSDKTSSPCVIWCSLQGMVNYEHALRVNQDTFRGIGKTSGQDPAYDAPTFRGIPLEYIAALDSAKLYASTLNAVDETVEASADAGAKAGPRYYFINSEYLKFVTHTENYCKMTEPFMPSAQPFTRVQVMDLWNNTVCRSRARHGIVGPNTEVTAAKNA